MHVVLLTRLCQDVHDHHVAAHVVRHLDLLRFMASGVFLLFGPFMLNIAFS